MDYYTTLILIANMTALVLIINTISNDNFNKRTKHGFIITLVFIIAGGTCEWIGISINGIFLFNLKKLEILLHSYIKLLEQIIVPVMIFEFTDLIFIKDKKSFDRKIIGGIILIFIVLEFISFHYGHFIFYVDSNNVYHHGMFYGMYIFIYTITSIFMLWNVFKFSCSIQNKDKTELIAIIVFLVVGVCIQMINENIKTCWLSITIATALFYLYYSNIIQVLDGLTSLLNQRCYKNWIERSNDIQFTIIIFDVNSFKYINDVYGHQRGDQILKSVAMILKEVYHKNGRCYRIGGDEFCVIIEKEIQNVKTLNIQLEKMIEQKREKEPEFPTLSYGISTYNPNSKDVHDVAATIKSADDKMYKMKRRMKESPNKM